MGASAIRLVIAEIASDRSIRTIEEASRGVLLGRDTFSTGAIRSQTVDAALAALENFRRVIDGYGVQHVRAVATSAVREARNGDVFLDRIQGRTGIAFEIINEAEESRLVFLAVRRTLGAQRGASRRVDAAGRGRRRQHEPDAAARRGSPIGPASTRSAPSGSASSSTCGG